MKKFLFVLGLVLSVCSCTSNETIIDNIIDEYDINNAITFSKYTDNLTRATTYERLDKTHTSFGVYGYYDNDTKDDIMLQYLVKFDASKLSNPDGTYTNPTHGASAWYYEGLTTSDGAAATQYLKFFDTSRPKSLFIGYTPYKTTDFTVYDKATNTIKFKNITKFSVHQTVTTADSIKIDKNELLYSKDKHSTYNTDVLINFKRGMAKVMLGFRDNIPGYKIQLLDLDTNYSGVQMVPATVNDTVRSKVQPTKTSRPTWKDSADEYTVKFETDNTVTLSVTDNTESQNNIVFDATNTESYTYNTENLKVIKEGTGDYSMSDSVYYMLPQTSTTLGFTLKVSYRMIPEDGTSDIKVYDARVYIPNSYCKWEAGKAYKYLVTITTASTGNTDKNVSEEDMGLKDTDGDGHNPNYPDGGTLPDGTTNPNNDSADNDKYVDGDDPRIPIEKALHPITFEAVVYDYDSTDTQLNLN